MGEPLRRFVERRKVGDKTVSRKERNESRTDLLARWKRVDSLSSDIAYLRSRYHSHKKFSAVYQNYRTIVRTLFPTGIHDRNLSLFISQDGNVRVRKESMFLYYLKMRIIQHDMTVRATMPWFLLVVALFALSTVASFSIVSLFTSYGEYFLPDKIVDSLQRGELWTNMLGKRPVSGALGIILNNVIVSARVFLSGVVFGIPSMISVLYNGWHLGSVFAITAKFHMALRLLQFVLGHGILEITVIIFSGALGMRCGLSFFSLAPSLRFQYFVSCFQDALNSIFVLSFWLVLCGIVESGISPHLANMLPHTLMVPVSLSLGVFVLGLYIYIHHGGIHFGRKHGNA